MGGGRDGQGRMHLLHASQGQIRSENYSCKGKGNVCMIPYATWILVNDGSCSFNCRLKDVNVDNMFFSRYIKKGSDSACARVCTFSAGRAVDLS